MKNNFIVLLLIMGLSVQPSYSQRREIKSTQVVFVLNEKSNKIEALELLEKDKVNDITKKYPKRKFYTGSISGEYKIDKKGIKPNKGSVLTMITKKNELPGDMFLPGDMYLPGDMFLPGDMYSTGNIFNIDRSKFKVKEISSSKLIFNTL